MKTSTKILGISLITLFGFGKSFAQAPVVDFNWAPVSPCVGQPVAITGSTISGGNPTAWGYSLTGATATSYTLQNPATTFTLAGVQTITLIAVNGLTPSAPVVHTLTVKAAPSMTVTSSASTAACPNTTANLTATGATAYAWVAPLTSTLAVATITVPGTTTTYSVVGTGTNGCTATATVVQNVTANPINVTSSSSVACANVSATLTATGGTTYAWQAPVTGTTSTAVITPTAAGNYTATVMATSSVCPGYTWTTAFTQSVAACTGIQLTAANKTSFSAYPNPTSGEITIELNNGMSKTVDVMDLTGRIVLTRTSSDDAIHLNINALAKGIYYVRVQSNNTIETTKIVKQ